MSVSTFGKVMGGLSVGIGGWVGYRAIKEHDEAGTQDKSGNHTTSGALERKAVADGVFAGSALASGVLALTGKGGKAVHGIINAVSFAALGATMVTNGGLKDARTADAEIAKLRGAADDAPTKSPEQRPHQTPRQHPGQYPGQFPTQRPPSPFDDLPVLVPGRDAGVAVSVD